MLDHTTIETLARELQDARKARRQVRHFSSRFPGMTVADGYAIQRAWVALEIADGRRIKGRKIGSKTLDLLIHKCMLTYKFSTDFTRKYIAKPL